MSKVLYLSEIVKFAIEKEQESYALYKNLHDMSSAPKLKALFKTLMEQEQHHEEFYKEMLTKVAEDQSPGVQEDDAYDAYMQELIAASRTVPTVAELDFDNHKVVIDYAIAREKDSILFYTGLKNFVQESVHTAIDKIIQEEGKHVAMLKGMCSGCCGCC